MGSFDKPTEEEINEGYRRMNKKVETMDNDFLQIVWNAIKNHGNLENLPYTSSCGKDETYKFVKIPFDDWVGRIYSEIDLRGMKH